MVSFMDKLLVEDKKNYLDLIGLINGHALEMEYVDDEEGYQEALDKKLDTSSEAVLTAVANFFENAL